MEERFKITKKVAVQQHLHYFNRKCSES